MGSRMETPGVRARRLHPLGLLSLYLENIAVLCKSSGLWCSGSRGSVVGKTSFFGSFRLKMLEIEKLVYPGVVVVFFWSLFVVVLLLGLIARFDSALFELWR